MEYIGVIIFFIIFFSIGVTFVVIAVRSDRERREKEAKSAASYHERPTSSASSGSTTMTDEQRRRLEYLRDQQKYKTNAEKHERHVSDAHEHGHEGVEEHYDEIVGSLGDINDEGCEDLNGVRFIAHDLAYELTENGEHDYAEFAKAMVLGEIVNSPRFKAPYSKR